MGDAIVALIRTVVPAIVGSAIAWLIAQGVDLDADDVETIGVAVVTICIGLYYFLVTLLERKVNPAFGWLLGYATPPTYPSPRPTTVDQVQDNEGHL